MKSSRATMAVVAMGIGVAACGGTPPSAPEVSTLPTELLIEPSAPTSDKFLRGLAAISVWPPEVGGTVTIEVCSDQGGQPMPGNFTIDLTACANIGGQWAIARDSDGQLWHQRELVGSTIIQFDRPPDQDGLLFRSSYRAPSTGYGEDVGVCPWVLAEGQDVGVLCTSDNDVRLLPVVRPGAGAVPTS